MDGWRATLWDQTGAAIDMFENAVRACPDALRDDGSPPPEAIWYGAYHALYYLDRHGSEGGAAFVPPPEIGDSENDPSGRLPDRVPTKAELLAYQDHGRRKNRARIEALRDEDLTRPCGFGGRRLTAAEVLLCSLRHVQRHAAPINLLLRRRAGLGLPWVSRGHSQ